MKKIKLLITLSLTLCVLAFGSASVFADYVTGDVVTPGSYVINNNDFSSLSYLHIQDFLFKSNNIAFDSIYVNEFGSVVYYFPLDDSSQISVFNSGNWLDGYNYITVSAQYTIRHDSELAFFNYFVPVDDVPAAPLGSGLAEDIFELFQSIIAWVVGFFGVFVRLFWTSSSGLTVLGVLAVIALGISIFFLIFAVVINFFRFRGR